MGATGKEPAKAGVSRLFPARKKPAFLAKRSRLFWPGRSRLPPASPASFPWRPKERGAGVSRRKPALFRPEAGSFGRKEPASAGFGRLLPSVAPKGAGFGRRKPASFLAKGRAGVSRRKPAFPCSTIEEAGESRRKPASSGRRSRLLAKRAGFFGRKPASLAKAGSLGQKPASLAKAGFLWPKPVPRSPSGLRPPSRRSFSSSVLL